MLGAALGLLGLSVVSDSVAFGTASSSLFLITSFLLFSSSSVLPPQISEALAVFCVLIGVWIILRLGANREVHSEYGA